MVKKNINLDYNINNKKRVSFFFKNSFSYIKTYHSFHRVNISFYFVYFSIKNFIYFKNFILWKKVYNFLNRKWFFDKLYNDYLGQF